MHETQVQSLAQKDPLKEGIGNPFQYSCLERSHGQRSLSGYSPRGCKRVRNNLATEHFWGCIWSTPQPSASALRNSCVYSLSNMGTDRRNKTRLQMPSHSHLFFSMISSTCKIEHKAPPVYLNSLPFSPAVSAETRTPTQPSSLGYPLLSNHQSLALPISHATLHIDSSLSQMLGFLYKVPWIDLNNWERESFLLIRLASHLAQYHIKYV